MREARLANKNYIDEEAEIEVELVEEVTLDQEGQKKKDAVLTAL